MHTITLVVPEDLKEAVVGEFSSDGIAGVWERDTGSAGHTELVFYFDPDRRPPLIEARLGRVFERNGYAKPEVSIGEQPDEDWTREWRKGFTAFAVGRRFQVVPSWESATPGGRIPIRIDPGLAFGTGTHETTQLMLEVLESAGPVPGRVCDLGTGSAILSIAAGKLGCRNLLACDIDSDAVQVARANLARNDCEAAVFIGSADAIRSGSVELLLANLTADVIQTLLPEMARIMAPSAKAIFSGVLATQTTSLQTEMAEAGFRVERVETRGEWTGILTTHGG